MYIFNRDFSRDILLIEIEKTSPFMEPIFQWRLTSTFKFVLMPRVYVTMLILYLRKCKFMVI